MTPRRKHPSGRPVRVPRIVARIRHRIPLDEPLTPRLAEPDHKTEAIGFFVECSSTDDDKDDE